MCPVVACSSVELLISYFQGTGGTGAPPFFHGTGGTGAPPFFHGTGGTGAPPLAIITAPSLCAITTVFKPIAPTKTNMARSRIVSLRDIECLRGIVKPRWHSISNYINVKGLTLRACSKRYTPTRTFGSLGIRPAPLARIVPTTLRVSSRSFMVNGTVVLKPIGLALGHRAKLPFDKIDSPAPSSTDLPISARRKRESLDTFAANSVAWTVLSCRRSSVVERGSHNP